MTSRFFFQLLSPHPPEDMPPRKSSKEAVDIEEATVASDGSHKGLAHTPSVTYDKYSRGICTYTCMRVRGTLARWRISAVCLCHEQQRWCLFNTLWPLETA